MDDKEPEAARAELGLEQGATAAAPAAEATLSPAAEAEDASPAPPIVPPRPTLTRSLEASNDSIDAGAVPPAPPPRPGSGAAAGVPPKPPPPPPPRRGSTIDSLTPPDTQRLRRPSDHHVVTVDAPMRQQHSDDPRPPMGMSDAMASRGSLLPTESPHVSSSAAPSPPVARAVHAARALVLAILVLLVIEGAAVADMARQDFVQTAYGIAAIIAAGACVFVHLWALVALLPLVRPHGITARASGLSAPLWPLLPVLGVTFVAMATTAVHAVLWLGGKRAWMFLAPAAHLPALWLVVRAFSALKTVEVRVGRRPVDNAQPSVHQRATSSGSIFPPEAQQQPQQHNSSQQPPMTAVRPPPALPGRGVTVASHRTGQSPAAAGVHRSEMVSAASL